jgi:hypothetical protein
MPLSQTKSAGNSKIKMAGLAAIYSVVKVSNRCKIPVLNFLFQ